MEEQKTLEETIKFESSNKEVAKGIIIPGYGFKLWYDDRKKYGTSFGELIFVAEVEMFKSLAYVTIGVVVYDAINKYF